ncbi:MAG: tRNA (guanosine(46)-N7)-methyltransferase TrmB [Bacteroidales bacterium]|nr:tRNA (guanosine(46)-N7)-methyltransferase TrmB [Bacteroidales bacterium]
MGHHKLQRFAENLTFPNLFQVGFDQLEQEGFALKGKWHEHFGNDNPITLELGCGKGDYTLALARIHPDRNYIGVDIKGARLWRGAKTAVEEPLNNVAFIRTRIELIDRFFAEGEVSEIWITFCDPQPKKPNKRLTAPRFLDTYARFLAPQSIMHLKTDSQELYDYTLNEVLPTRNVEVIVNTNDLYAATLPQQNSATLSEAQLTQTFYERMFLAEGKPITYIKWKLSDLKAAPQHEA